MNKLNFTLKIEKMQQIIENSSKEIEKYFPNDMDESAKIFGALKRKRGVENALDLLQMLLIYATSRMSIRTLALAANALKISSISDTAWNKKITASVDWLMHLLNILLLNTIKPQTADSLKSKQVYLIDGSCFRQEGKEEKIYRVHMSYCLNTGCMHEIKVTDKHKAESLAHYSIQKNSIYIADAGYGKTTQIEYVLSKKADVIFRITPNNISLYDGDGKKIDMASLLKTKETLVEINCFAKCEKAMIPIRIIASQLPEDKIEAAIKRKKRKSQKNQSKIKESTLIYAKWVIIATSLDKSYICKDILTIYRSRWQIELLFKRMKQNLNAHTIRPASDKYALALLHLWLITWALAEKQVFAFEQLLIQKNIDLNRVSVWSLHSFFYKRTVSIIENQWVLLIDPSNVELLSKYLLNHKSSRNNHYAYFHLEILLRDIA